MNSMDARGGALLDGYSSIIDAECDSLCKELEGKHCVCSNKVDMPRLWQTLLISKLPVARLRDNHYMM